MNKIVTTLLLGVALTTMGCATQRRSVTHIRVDKDNAYLAYAEWDEGAFTGFTGSNDRSRVKHCRINPDNTLKCEEDADVNKVLNPQEAGEAPAAAPKEEAPPADPAAAPPAVEGEAKAPPA